MMDNVLNIIDDSDDNVMLMMLLWHWWSLIGIRQPFKSGLLNCKLWFLFYVPENFIVRNQPQLFIIKGRLRQLINMKNKI